MPKALEIGIAGNYINKGLQSKNNEAKKAKEDIDWQKNTNYVF
jgi:hypothetical protein